MNRLARSSLFTCCLMAVCLGWLLATCALLVTAPGTAYGQGPYDSNCNIGDTCAGDGGLPDCKTYCNNGRACTNTPCSCDFVQFVWICLKNC